MTATQRLAGILVMACSIAAAPPAEAQDESLYHIVSKVTNGCLRVQDPPEGAIVAGLLRTFPHCYQTPDMLVERLSFGGGIFYRYRISESDYRCVHVTLPPYEQVESSLPIEMFASDCDLGTKQWREALDDDGFRQIRLDSPPVFPPAVPPLVEPLCMEVDATTTRIRLDQCSDKPEQKWEIRRIER